MPQMVTLDDIVAAAAKVFRTKGYHAATVQDIAAEVGILKGSLYNHLDSKEELLYLVVKEPITQMYRTMGEIASGTGKAADKLRRAITAHLEAFDRHFPHLFVYLREREAVKRRFREMIGFPERVRAILAANPSRRGRERRIPPGSRYPGDLLRPARHAELAVQMVRSAGPPEHPSSRRTVHRAGAGRPAQRSGALPWGGQARIAG